MLAAQRERDARDTEREHGALRAAEDAVELDTTGLALDEVVDRVVALRPRAGPRHERACPPSPSSASPTSARAPWSTAWSAAREAVTARRAGRHPRPQAARCEWNGRRLRAGRHRRHRPRGRGRAGPRRPGARRGSAIAEADAVAAGRRRPRRPARRRRRAGQDAARRRRAGRSSSSTKPTAPTTTRSPPSSTRSASASRSRSPPPTASAPATCSTAIVDAARRRGRRGRGRRRGPRRRDRPPQRRQVLAGQRLPRLRPGDRLRRRRHHPRRDRHRARGRRPAR